MTIYNTFILFFETVFRFSLVHSLGCLPQSYCGMLVLFLQTVMGYNWDISVGMIRGVSVGIYILIPCNQTASLLKDTAIHQFQLKQRVYLYDNICCLFSIIYMC